MTNTPHNNLYGIKTLHTLQLLTQKVCERYQKNFDLRQNQFVFAYETTHQKGKNHHGAVLDLWSYVCS